MSSHEQLKKAIVESVEHGVYPDAEVSTGELPSTLLPALLADLQKARDEVKTDIRQMSKDVAPDVDGWIAQAKKLQADIERSKATARDIVSQAEAGKALKEKTKDTSNKVQLLQKEVAFDESLATILDQIRTACRILESVNLALANNDLDHALSKIKECDVAVTSLAAVQDSRPVGLLQTRITRHKAALLDKATELAHAMIHCNSEESIVTVTKHVEQAPNVDISMVINILTYLGGLEQYMKRLRRELETSLVDPRLSSHVNRPISIVVDRDSIRASQTSDKPDTITTLDDIWKILNFLSTRLPESVCAPLSQKLLPSLLYKLTSEWLDGCVPVEIDQMPLFQQILDRVMNLSEQIDELNWSGTGPLKEWVQDAPRTWLSKRRETALGAARSLLFSSLKERKTVERVETQTISKGDVIMGGTDHDDVDAAWDEEWEEESVAKSTDENASVQATTQHEDEDASAWEMDVDDEPEPEVAAKTTEDNEDDVDADAWGWGDEDPAGEETSKPEPAPKPQHQERSNPAAKARGSVSQPAERELTLRETYTVTAVPDGILDIIMQVVSDAETLTDPSYTNTPIGPAASALYTLPTFVLAIYRATASTAYSKLDTGNMLIYNDASRLADQIRSFLTTQTQKDNNSPLPPHLLPSSRLKLDNDIKALETFAKRAYSAEMESQRTIIRDMLDGAQGFSNCTEEPFASECSSAVSITEQRVRDVYTQWKPILSHSALLQSTGSLLSTIISKLLLEISDLSDIGEDESKKLRSLCDKISELKDLFIHQHPENGEQGNMTGIYCPNWFKFQYLGELLESSLADIKWMWMEGELRLEFGVDEVVDLIEALFADSEYRRKAIADIKRS